MKVNELMGKIVLVAWVYQRCNMGYENNHTKKGWIRQPAEFRPGWVTGERWIQEGTVYHNAWDDEAQGAWEEKGKRRHVLLVCYWPMMKPVLVPSDQDIKYPQPSWVPAPKNTLPYRTDCPWPQGTREFIRKEMSAWPRDAKGRWVKKEMKLRETG